jgi:hypothetical protein
MDTLVDSVIIMATLIAAVAGLVWHSRRSRTLLERWAERNGYRIIDADYRNFFRGPFFWSTTKGQTVYRVTLQIGVGIVRRGFVRCGSRRLGLLSDRVEVRWDEAPAEGTSLMHDRWLDG